MVRWRPDRMPESCTTEQLSEQVAATGKSPLEGIV
jgi:hypothetical protein